jgi:fatty acid desaturase
VSRVTRDTDIRADEVFNGKIRLAMTTPQGVVTHGNAGDGAANLGTGSLLADLHKVRPKFFWVDLITSATIGWLAFAMAAADATPFKWRCVFTLIASLAFYRGLCFLHEITHMRRMLLKGFETTWNVLFGIPLFMPSVMYVGVHQNHHKLGTYGTFDDPEYLPFAGKPWVIAGFTLQSLFLPIVLAIRFLVLSWFGLILPPFHRWLARHASSITMNMKYVRPVNAQLMRTITLQELMVLCGWGAGFTMIYLGIMPLRALAVWYVAIGLLCVINTLRTLAAHRYQSSGQPLGRDGQVEDSVDIPGGLWTELWAPVGLRYHAVHHYFPGVPYHNLGAAYRRIQTSSPTYQQCSEKSLVASLRSLILKKY